MGEEEAEKIQETAKSAHKEAMELPLSLEEKRKLFGERLRSTREQLKQTKKDVIHLTRISPPFIEALEDGKFEALPGEVFGRGFVKNICKVLEIDASSLLEEYNQCWEHKQVKARSYSYSRRLSTGRKDHKSKKSLPFTNYFSLKGIVLWVLGPSILVCIALLIIFNVGNSPSSPSHKKQVQRGLEEVGKNDLSSRVTGSSVPDNSAKETSHPSKPIGEAEPLEPLDKSQPDKIAAPSKESSELSKKEEAPDVQPVIEIAPKGFSLTNGSKNSSYLMVMVKNDTTIKHRFDQGSYEVQEYQKGLYKFRFKEKIDLFCDDMSKLEVTFNGRKLGDFGVNRDAKQLSFIGKQADHKKL